MEPCYSTQLHQQLDEFRRLQWQLQKARVQNLGEELASLLQCRSEADFLSPWCSTTSFHDTLDNKGTSFTDAAFWEVNLSVPIWIRLPLLDLKYWGLDCVGRIVGGVGRVLEVDYASGCRERLQFARVLIEVEVGQRFPEFVRFEDGKGEEIEQRVQYEWKPSVCCRCEGIGHGDLECKLAPKQAVAGKKVWRIKKDGRRISRKPGFDGGIRS